MKMDRRTFFKASAGSAVVAGSLAAFGTGVSSGSDPITHHGWQNNKIDQYFDRTPFEVDKPTYNKIGEVRRPSGFDYVFGRRDAFLTYLKGYDENLSASENLAKLGVTKPEDATVNILTNEDLKQYYRDYADRKYLEEDVRYYLEVLPFKAKMDKEVSEFGDDALHKAFFGGFTSFSSAFRNGDYAVKSKDYDFEGVNDRQYGVKDPEQMSRLIKKVGMLYGSPIVRITKLNPDWVYATHNGGRGYKPNEPIEVPKHWKYAIVVGSPMEWDSFRANPSFGASSDGYMRASILADQLTRYIKLLGYPARPNSPYHGYDMVLPPILIDAGVGEQGRLGTCITPEFGGNFRPAVVVTDMPLAIDKPINVGIKKFCENCEICAEQCPSQSIPFGGVGSINNRGYEGWCINTSTCHNYWRSVPVSGSCRICVTVCPFSKKSGWIHVLARDMAVREKSGLTAKTLTWMEKNFFGEKEAAEYIYELGSRKYPHVKEIPWWLNAAEFLEI